MGSSNHLRLFGGPSRLAADRIATSDASSSSVSPSVCQPCTSQSVSDPKSLADASPLRSIPAAA